MSAHRRGAVPPSGAAMDRRRFLLGLGAAAGLTAVVAPARRILAPTLDVDFLPAGDGAQLPGSAVAHAWIGGAAALEQALDVGACVAGGPPFSLVCTQVQGGLVHVSPPRRLAIHDRLSLEVDGATLEIGGASLPLRQGAYVAWLTGARRPRQDLRLDGFSLVDGTGSQVEVPHLVVDLQAAALL